MMGIAADYVAGEQQPSEKVSCIRLLHTYGRS